MTEKKTYTRAEIAALQEEHDRLMQEYMKFDAYQMAVKLTINSIYGAFGSPFFYFYSPIIAETVTKQGKDLITYTEKMINLYFRDMWFDDIETHKKLGINVTKQIKNDVSVYIDTDSVAKDSEIQMKNYYVRVISNGQKLVFKSDDVVSVMRNDEMMEINAYEMCENDLLESMSFAPIDDIKITNTLTIEEVYELNKDTEFMTDNHENVLCDDQILNLDLEDDAFSMYYADVKKIIRHKVTKDKWKISGESASVITTGDHSIMVLRNAHSLIQCKPADINVETDELLVNGGLELITECECIGKFEDEYVYDIEIDDVMHAFIANGILVHNSCYTSFYEPYLSCDWGKNETDNDWEVKVYENENDEPTLHYFCGSRPADEVRDVYEKEFPGKKLEMRLVPSDRMHFVFRIVEAKIANYFNECLDIYAEKRNTDNYQKFEMESYSNAGIWLGKKHYVQDCRWTEPNVFYEPYSYIKSTGVELIKASFPKFSRDNLTKTVKWLMQNPNYDQRELQDYVFELKREFQCTDIDDICFNLSVNNYPKFVIDDTNGNLILKSGIPYNVRAAAYHNSLINAADNSIKSNYGLILDGEKIKLYYSTSPVSDVFAYSPGKRPPIAPSVDYDTQFEKVFINPINRFLEAMGRSQINPTGFIEFSLF